MKIIKLPSKELHSAYLIYAQELVDNALGENTFLKQCWNPYLHAWISVSEPQNMLHIPKIVGYCSAIIRGDEGIMKTCVVDEWFRGEGVATKLVKHRLDFMKDKGVKKVKSFAWFVDGYCPAQKPLMRNGLKPIKDVRGFYEREHNEKFRCSKCGAYCRCVARIFELNL